MSYLRGFTWGITVAKASLDLDGKYCRSLGNFVGKKRVFDLQLCRVVDRTGVNTANK